MGRGRVRWGRALAVVLVVTGCSSSSDGALSDPAGSAAASSAARTDPAGTDTPGTDTPVPTGASTTMSMPDSTAAGTVADTTATTATTSPTSEAPTTTVELPVLSDAPCAFTPLGDLSSAITFARDGRVYQLSPDSITATCLVDQDAGIADALRWSPSGEAVLLDSSRLLDASGVRDTGYRADNTGVSWSYPTGKALIAPAVADGALLWRTAGEPGTRRDISFLAHTDVAAYHVAGKNVFAAGVDPDGVAGVFVASNRGENRRTVATLDDPSTHITELVSDVSGQRLYIVHDHGSFWELHSVDFPGLLLGTLLDTPDPISHLTVGTDTSQVAVQLGDCSGITTTTVPFWPQQDIGTGTELDGRSTTPVGWLDGDHLVVAARTTGCTGPADVWVVDSSGSLRRVLTAVDSVSVRARVGSFGELPDDINAQAPG